MTNVEVILSAFGLLITTIGTVLGGWWIKISQNNHTQKVELEKLRTQAEIEKSKAEASIQLRSKRDTTKEWTELSDNQSEMLRERSQEVHDLRDRVHTSEIKEKACQLRVTQLESKVEEQESRLEEAFQHISDLEDALSKAGVNVIRRRQPNKPGSKNHIPMKDNGHG